MQVARVPNRDSIAGNDCTFRLDRSTLHTQASPKSVIGSIGCDWDSCRIHDGQCAGLKAASPAHETNDGLCQTDEQVVVTRTDRHGQVSHVAGPLAPVFVEPGDIVYLTCADGRLSGIIHDSEGDNGLGISVGADIVEIGCSPYAPLV